MEMRCWSVFTENFWVNNVQTGSATEGADVD